tara:strand:+ start:518 stop:2254 length:1737 start_codon:yes stop_codon:yes gene_type:complete
MSTQFRSRIKTVVDYSANAAATGGCCLPDGTKLIGDDITINECNRQNGFFRAGDSTTLQCPDRGLTGCCCACSYVREQEGDFENFLQIVLDRGGSDSTVYHQTPEGDNLNINGYKDNVSQCECSKRQGNWFYGKCEEVENITSLCGSILNQTDVRVPAACCHGTENDGVECDNVCTAKECSDLTAATDGISVYYGDEVGGNGALCDWSYITNPASCGSAANNTERRSYGDDSTLKSSPTAQARNRKYPCFTLTTIDNELKHVCSSKTPEECFNLKGYQYPSGNDSYSCSDVSSLIYAPKRGSGSLRVFPPTISSSISLPRIGDHYQGGIYMGTFKPGGSINSKPSVIKRRINDKMEEIKSRGDGSGTNKKKWALIYSYRSFGDLELLRKSYLSKVTTTDLDRVPLKLAMNSIGEAALSQPTSFYDGFFNTYGDGGSFGGYNSKLLEEVRSLVFNGFNDWYIPSIDELSLIYKNFSHHKNGYYDGTRRQPFYDPYGSMSILLGVPTSSQYKNMMSSTLWSENDKLGKSEDISSQIVGGKGYFYAQNMRDDDKGKKRGLVYKADRRTKLIVPLVRRIYID